MSSMLSDRPSRMRRAARLGLIPSKFVPASVDDVARIAVGAKAIGALRGVGASDCVWLAVPFLISDSGYEG